MPQTRKKFANLSRQIARSYRNLSPHVPAHFLPISAGLSLGCLLSAVLPSPISLWQLIILYFVLSPLLARSLWKNNPTARRYATTILVCAMASLTGWLWHSPRLPNHSLPSSQNRYSAWIVEISSLPKATAKTFKYLVRTHLFCPKDSTPIPWNTMATLYVNARDSCASALVPGQLFLLMATIQPFKNADSSLFSFTSWAHAHGIAGFAFANTLSLIPLNVSHCTLQLKALHLHHAIINKMKAAGIGPPELGPIVAMTLGERSELSPEINRHFRNSGLAHILAISGFHVGIIFWIFQLLVKPITIQSRFSAAARHLTPILAIWAYAAFCGLAPPIVRAASIVSVFAIALFLQVNISRLDAFFISLAIVLLAQPAAPFDIGFYLSFIAVAGIAIFLPFFNDIIRIKNKTLRAFANLFLISLAAQIATTPFILFAFHSLPAIGILASAPASLLAFPILVGGILIALLPQASTPALLVAFPLKWAGKSLVYISKMSDQINPEILSNISLPNLSILLAAASVITLALYALYRKKLMLLSALTAIGATFFSAFL